MEMPGEDRAIVGHEAPEGLRKDLTCTLSETEPLEGFGRGMS